MNGGERASALGDLRVIDLTSGIAGPYATKLLADFGADVIKVEPPTGDPARAMGPFMHDEPHYEHSLLFLYLNTNKRSITLDLSTSLGRKLLSDLVEWADVLVEGFRPGVMAEMGLGYEDLARIKSGLVMLSITPFGQSGPYKDYKGGELVEYALGGFMYTFGEYDREPIKHGGFQAQYKAGTNAAIAALVALCHQRATGEGQHVDVASIECQAATIRDTTSLYTYMGAIRRRSPKEQATSQGEQTFGGSGRIVPCKDGYFVGGRDGVPRAGLRAVDWAAFVDLVGSEELHRFADERERRSNYEEMRAILNREFMKRSKYEVVEAGQQRRFMYGPVEDAADLVKSPQLAARGFFTTVDRPDTGPITYPGEPFRMSETPWAIHRPAPTLGEHNSEVYGDMLGHNQQTVARLRQLNVI